jgi:HSP20 family protein
MIPTAKCIRPNRPAYRRHTLSHSKGSVNIRKFDDRFTIEALMPGYKMEDIAIKLEDDTLYIEAQTTFQEDPIKYVKREFDHSRFERSFHLGQKIDSDSIKATMDAGILFIDLPLRAEKQKRNITIL